MRDTCGSCELSKRYGAGVKNAKQQVYCTWWRKGVNVNGVCEEYERDGKKLWKALPKKAKRSEPCVECGWTQFAHTLRGMRSLTCGEYRAPEYQQEELFSITAYERKGVIPD